MSTLHRLGIVIRSGSGAEDLRFRDYSLIWVVGLVVFVIFTCLEVTLAFAALAIVAMVTVATAALVVAIDRYSIGGDDVLRIRIALLNFLDNPGIMNIFPMAAIVFLVIAVLPMPYWYYVVLRSVVFYLSISLFLLCLDSPSGLLMLAIAVMYNPFHHLTLSIGAWRLVDIYAIFAFRCILNQMIQESRQEIVKAVW